MLNTYLGVGADGTTPAGNTYGVFVSTSAADCTIGALGEGSLVIVSGNTNQGVMTYGANTHVINAYLGVAKDGYTPVPSKAVDQPAIYIKPGATGCTIGGRGGDLVVVGGMLGPGIYDAGAGTTILNTRIGVGT